MSAYPNATPATLYPRATEARVSGEIAVVGQMTAAVSPDVYTPRTMAEAWKLAETFHASGLLPRGVTSPAAAFTIIATGAELGLSPMASLRSIHVIEGKPVLSAALIAGIVQRRPDLCESFALVESSDTMATYETTRRGHAPVRMSFTLEQAQRAGLTGKDNWRKYPHAMLRARASAELARAVYPDVVGGLYDPDEIPGADMQPARREPAAPIVAQPLAIPAPAPSEPRPSYRGPNAPTAAPPSEPSPASAEDGYLATLATLETAAQLGEFAARVPIADKTPRLREAFAARLAAIKGAA